MKPPSLSDRAVKVAAYLTDETFGYEHWRAAQFSAPSKDKFGLLLLFDTEAERDRAYAAGTEADARTPAPPGEADERT